MPAAQVALRARRSLYHRSTGKPFTTFNHGVDANKPFCARSLRIGQDHHPPLPHGRGGGESHDDPHDRGCGFYDDVNGVKFWKNDPSYASETSARSWCATPTAGSTLSATTDDAPKGNTLLVESGNDVPRRCQDTRDRSQITLTAAEDVTLGDTKEGAFAIRRDDHFTEKKGAR